MARLRMLLVALGGVLGVFATPAVVVHAHAFIYDVPQVACVEADVALTDISATPQVSGPSVRWRERLSGALGASTTFSGAFIATNTVGIPSSSDTKLQNYIDQLYKHANKPGTVGNGTTMDAIPGEIAAGGGRHIQKGEEIARGLRNWLARNPNAPYCDRLLAQSLYDELVRALGYEPS